MTSESDADAPEAAPPPETAAPMDIHKPKPIHSVRDFLGEIGTITLGILIALALEAVVVDYQHRKLVDHARDDMRAELTNNRHLLAATAVSGTKLLPALDQAIVFMRARAAGKPAKDPGVSLDGEFSSLGEAAWESTVATQALAYMPAKDAQTLSVAYAAARGFDTFEDQVERQWFELAAIPDFSAVTPSDAKEALRSLTLNRALIGALTKAASDAGTAHDRALQALKD
jgi:hypothetical protein